MKNKKTRGPEQFLEPVYETLARVRQELPGMVTLLGFCGAPWTLATYMIAGSGTVDQFPARSFAYRFPDAFSKLIDILIEASTSTTQRGGPYEARGGIGH